MTKIFIILVLAIFGTFSLDACAAKESQAPQVKHRVHSKVKAKPVKTEKTSRPVRNGEWYLDQARSSGRFKAAALGSESAKFSSSDKVDDHLLQQATISNHPIIENNKNTESIVKKNSSLENQNKITVMFVPPFLNNKLMDMQKHPDMHPTVTISWKE